MGICEKTQVNDCSPVWERERKGLSEEVTCSEIGEGGHSFSLMSGEGTSMIRVGLYKVRVDWSTVVELGLLRNRGWIVKQEPDAGGYCMPC